MTYKRLLAVISFTVIIIFASSHVILVLAQDPGDYIVIEYLGHNLSRLTPEGGRGVEYTFYPGVNPWGIAIDSEGNYIVTEYGGHNLTKITQEGVRTMIHIFDSGIFPEGVAIDAAGNFIVTGWGADNLVKITPDGVRTVIYGYTTEGPRGVAIYPDLVPPTVSISSPIIGSELQSSMVTTTWIGLDADSNIDYYEIRLDEGSWINTMTATSYTFAGVSDGDHTFHVKAVDDVGNFGEVIVNFTVTLEAGGLDLTTMAIIGIAVIAVVAIVSFLILRRRKAS